eukprot:COSAG01_NODE_5365_length_4308_cov_1.852697_4_plen_77_part_00
MEAINFGSMYWAGHGGKGSGAGPWVQADLEHGTWAGNRSGVNRCGVRDVFQAAVLAEIYLCNVCSCQEILRRNGRG